MSLIIVGSLAFDTIETPHDRRERIVGGSGSYCSLAASFFTAPKIVGVVGEDFPKDVPVRFSRGRRSISGGSRSAAAGPSHWEGHTPRPETRGDHPDRAHVFVRFPPVSPSPGAHPSLANITPLRDDILNRRASGARGHDTSSIGSRPNRDHLAPPWQASTPVRNDERCVC